MKAKIIVILLLFVNFLFGQDTNVGYVVEHNLPIEIDYSVFLPPLRINKVDTQSEIDYSNIEGLLKSYLSASDAEWAKYEYLDEDPLIVRSNKHFNAVKESSTNDYIQMESIYRFEYDKRQMAYVKYSFVFEKVPFPFIGILSIEYVNDRWYLSNLLNQGAVYELLGKVKTEFLQDFFMGSTGDKDWNSLINKSKNKNGISDIALLYKNIEELKMANNKVYDNLIDERMLYETAEFRNASFQVDKEKNKFTVSHPFLYKNIEFFIYTSKENNLIKNEKTDIQYLNTSELQLLSDVPIQLIHKLHLVTIRDNYFIIKYKKLEKKEIAVIRLEENSFSILDEETTKSIDDIKRLVLISDSYFLNDIFQNKNDQIAEFVKGSDGGININFVIDYINSNKASLAKYLDE